MKQIRRSVFETNSSSVHSISIIKKVDSVAIPKQIFFDNECEFGWSVETLNDVNSKANYLMSAIACTAKDKDELDRNVELFLGALSGTKCNNYGLTFEYHHWDGHDYFSFGGIDHGNELEEWVQELLGNHDLLYNFLFSENSVIQTGNDNDESDYPEPWQAKDPNYFVYIKEN